MLEIKVTLEEQSLTVATEQLDCCPNCGSKQIKFWCKGHDRLHSLSTQVFVYSNCKECDLLFLSIRPPEQEVYKFYPPDYAPYQTQPKVASEIAVDPLSEKRSIATLPQRALNKIVSTLNEKYVAVFPNSLPQKLRQFYKPATNGLKLLDFGCGSERFLNSARQQGWETLGIDFSLDTIKKVQSSGHQAFLMSPNVWQEIDNESLDCVRMSHVLEHLYQPKQVLAALHCKMKSGAKIHVSVPNSQSIAATLFRSCWFDLDCPRHVILYSPALLKQLLIESDYSDIEIVHQSVPKNFLRSLEYFLQDIHQEQDWIGQDDATRQQLEQLFFIPAGLSALIGASDRFHVFAVKK